MIITILFRYFLIASLTLIAFVQIAQAKTWSGTQVLAIASAEKSLNDSESVGLRVHVSDFRVPTGTLHMNFLYLGPTFTLEPSENSMVWISPQIAGALNFLDKHDTFGPSLWVLASWKQFSLFTLGDVYFGPGSWRAFYGFSSADFAPLDWLKCGMHFETVNTDFTIGPHVAVKKGLLQLQLQYHWGKDSHAIRILPTVQF